jgi:uncharacterized metal-binding protein
MKTKKNGNLIFVCAGAADVGEITDRAARQLTREGKASLSCLASVAARDADIMFNVDLAAQVLLIDGCPKACAQKAFALAGLKNTRHLELSQLGLLKGNSASTAENIQTVVNRASQMLAG